MLIIANGQNNAFSNEVLPVGLVIRHKWNEYLKMRKLGRGFHCPQKHGRQVALQVSRKFLGPSPLLLTILQFLYGGKERGMWDLPDGKLFVVLGYGGPVQLLHHHECSLHSHQVDVPLLFEESYMPRSINICRHIPMLSS